MRFSSGPQPEKNLLDDQGHVVPKEHVGAAAGAHDFTQSSVATHISPRLMHSSRDTGIA